MCEPPITCAGDNSYRTSQSLDCQAGAGFFAGPSRSKEQERQHVRIPALLQWHMMKPGGRHIGWIIFNGVAVMSLLLAVAATAALARSHCALDQITYWDGRHDPWLLDSGSG